MNLRRFCALTADNRTAIAEARRLGILATQGPLCEECGRQLTEVASGTQFITDGRMWRCPSHKKQKRSIRIGSWFRRSHLSIGDILFIMYEWAYEVPVTTAAHQVEADPSTVVDWYQF